MKKIATLIGIVVLTTACKKDYTCTCTPIDTEIINGSSEVTTYSENKIIIKGVSKDVAEQKCVTYEHEYTEYYDGDEYILKEKNSCSLTKI